MTQQVETATIIGTITLTGNASITVTSGRMATGVSPKTISVAVTNGDTASIAGAAVRLALAFDADVAKLYQVSGTGASIILTRWVEEANDTTLNIASANGTCTGLTAQPTSTNTTAGSGLNNAYCTLDQYKGYQRVTNTDATDDAYIELAINGASRWIDRESKTNFYGTTETHLYDVPAYNRLVLPLDKYFTSITSVTNGDGTTLTTTSDYYLMPPNGTPISAISLFDRSNNRWNSANGRLQQCITVVGVTGYATTTPDDIVIACMEIAKALYSRRFGENMNMKTIITQAGVVVIPEGVPDMTAGTIAKYRRLAI